MILICRQRKWEVPAANIGERAIERAIQRETGLIARIKVENAEEIFIV